MFAWLIGQQHQRGDFWNNNGYENELHMHQGHFCSIKKSRAQALKLGSPGYKSLVTLNMLFNPSETQFSSINKGINNYLKRS